MTATTAATPERTTVASPNPPRHHSPHFFARETDGTVRIRMRFSAEEAALFEEAAGDVPVVTWLHKALRDAARKEVHKRRAQQPRVSPPE